MSDRSYQVEESCFSQEFHNASLRNCLKRVYSMSQLCSSRHDFPVTLHTPGAYVSDHNGDT